MRWDQKLSKEELTLYKRALDDVKSIETLLYDTIKFAADIKMGPERIKALGEILEKAQSLLYSIDGDIKHQTEKG